MTQGSTFFSLEKVQKAIDYIEENLLSDISPDMVASYFFVSVPTLATAFKVVCGMTITEYVRNRRLSLAGEELRDSGSSIIALAYRWHPSS